jgi:hypothetical protein
MSNEATQVMKSNTIKQLIYMNQWYLFVLWNVINVLTSEMIVWDVKQR